MNFAFTVIDTIRYEHPELFDPALEAAVRQMLAEAVEAELAFAEDVLSDGIAGLSVADMKQYLQYIADCRLKTLGFSSVYGSKNPFDFMALQDVQELTNFFERRSSAYRVGVDGDVRFDESF
jgi:ribonucleoside-diphosphate reductase beta chain